MIISAPATSANLGPGFDCLGIAWDCFNEIEFLLSDETVIMGCPEEYQNTDNLCYKAFKYALAYRGKPALPVNIIFRNCEIPIARGFGSSAALIVCGIKGANELYDLGLTEEEIINIATKFEGHPDNVVPAIVGGLIVATVRDDIVSVASLPVHPSWRFTAFIPDYELSTAMARSVLPESYSRADVVKNIGCMAMLIKSMETGDKSFLKSALNDRIHEPYRRSLIPEYDQVEQLVMDCGGNGICISGAGSTLLCFSDPEAQAEMIRRGREMFPTWSVRDMKIYEKSR